MMDKLFEKFINLIDKLPPALQLTIIAIILFIIPVYRIFRGKNVQSSIVQWLHKRLGHLTSKDLQYHRLFGKQEVFRNAINNIMFNSDNKTVIFRKILSVKLDSDIHMSKFFTEDKELFEMDKNALCTKMICQVNLMVKTYDIKALESLQLFFGKDIGFKLFDFVMNSPGGFREKRVDRINRIIHQVDVYLRDSQIFDNNIERIEFFLTEIQYALRISILEAEKMFADFNGEIDKIAENGLK